MSGVSHAALIASYAVRSLAFLTTGSNGGAGVDTVTIPASARAGDLAVLTDYGQTAGAPPDVTPSGWTGIGTATGPNGRSRGSYKVLAASDPGSVITCILGVGTSQKIITVFRPDGVIRAVASGSYAGEIVTSDPILQTVAASGQGVPLAVMAMATTNTGTANFTTMSPAFDATVLSSDSFARVGYKLYTTSPANHDVDMADLGFNSLQSFWISVS